MWTDDWRRNLVALCFGQVLSAAGFYFFMPIIPLYVQSLGAYETTEAVQWAGAMSASTFFALAMAQPVWGALADRWGRKPMVLRSMLGSAIMILLQAVASSPQQLMALYTLQGLISGVIAASTALVASSVPRQHLGFALGMLQVAVFVGTSFGPLGGGVIADAFGFRAAYLGAACLLLVGTALVSVLVTENFSPTTRSSRKGFLEGSRSLFRISPFPLLVAVIFLMQFGNTTVGPVLSLFVADLARGGNAATAVGMVMAGAGAASAVSAFAAGRLGDRIGHVPVLLACLAGTALSYFPQSLVHEVWELVLLRMLMGAFLGGLMPSANALVAEVIPRERRGAAFGLTSSSSALSQAIGPLFGAGTATLWGMRAVFTATGSVYALTLLWAGLSLRTKASRARGAEVVAGIGEDYVPTPAEPTPQND